MLKYEGNVDAFVKEVLGKYPDSIFLLAHLRPQFHFLCNCDRSIAVDFVGKLENIDKDWDTVCKNIGIDVKLPHTNESKHEHFSQLYSPESAEIVASLYHEDIDIFGYQFEPLES